MMKSIAKYIPIAGIVCAILLPLMSVHSCANTTEAPTGGDKDTIPPYIIDIKPLPGAVNVPLEGAAFVFTFNEYVQIKTASNIFLSPPQKKAPKSRLRGRNLIVSFEEPLNPNTTYTLSFTDAIADTNEGNPFAGYTYVFSTGERIDSLMLTGTVLDCSTLAPVKGATVLLHKSSSDSAVFSTLPYAAAKTDDWGYFVLPFIQDTLYRLYAIKDGNGDNLYDPESEKIAFLDSAVRPLLYASDTVREMLRYDMLDTLACNARTSQYELKLFRERPGRQYLVNKVRTAERSAYITFQAPYAWIDSLWVSGYRPDQIITQFNIMQDSLEIWLNSRRAVPDTMHIFVGYRKTDSLGVLAPVQEHIRLALTNEARTFSKRSRKQIRHEDTVCVYKLEASPETVEQNGYSLTFRNPIISERFDSIEFRYITPRQREVRSSFTVERDSMDLKHYTIRPAEELLPGYEYYLKIPYGAFRDNNGYLSDSTELKITLPSDESLSVIKADFTGVDRKIIVDLMSEKRDRVLRSYVIDRDAELRFPYLRKGKYCIRITEDVNRNSIVDTGSLLEHRQPERVLFYEMDGERFIDVPSGVEILQKIDLRQLLD